MSAHCANSGLSAILSPADRRQGEQARPVSGGKLFIGHLALFVEMPLSINALPEEETGTRVLTVPMPERIDHLT